MWSGTLYPREPRTQVAVPIVGGAIVTGAVVGVAFIEVAIVCSPGVCDTVVGCARVGRTLHGSQTVIAFSASLQICRSAAIACRWRDDHVRRQLSMEWHNRKTHSVLVAAVIRAVVLVSRVAVPVVLAPGVETSGVCIALVEVTVVG